MLLVKTKEFHKKFLYDLGDITIFRREYIEAISKWDKEGKLDNVGYGNQPSQTVKFFGSYFTKNYGKNITDIDVILVVKSINDDRIFLRLPQIFRNLDRTNFKFIRFYCGYIQGLEPPWIIGDEGDCQFDIDKVDKWVDSIRLTHPNVYQKVKPYLDKKTVSMMDLLKADSAIESSISLVWSKEEIIQGYKVYNGVRYNLREVMRSYRRWRVMKFMYKYKDTYCLVDLNFVAKDGSLPHSSGDYATYYVNDRYKKFKYLKKMLGKEDREMYLADTKEAIGHITPLAAFIELVDKLKKYKITTPEKVAEFEKFGRDYAAKNRIPTIDYDKLQEIILEKTLPLYDKYQDRIEEKYKPSMFVAEIRTRQVNEQVNKETLRRREKEGYDCPLFPMSVSDIKVLYNKAKDCMIDPYELYNCLEKVSKETGMYLPGLVKNVFSEDRYVIIKEDEKYVLIKDGERVKISKKLKKLQRWALIGSR